MSIIQEKQTHAHYTNILKTQESGNILFKVQINFLQNTNTFFFLLLSWYLLVVLKLFINCLINYSK